MKVQTYLNPSRKAPKPTRHVRVQGLVAGPVLSIERKPGQDEDSDLCEQVQRISMHLRRDDAGVEWPHDVRRIDYGDVVVIGEAAYAMSAPRRPDLIGQRWVLLATEDVVGSLAAGDG